MGIRGLIFFSVLLFSSVFVNGGGLAFKVTHKFGGEANRSLKDLLYYTKLAIGSPPKYYFLHVDTGSDVIWVNCAQCSPCSPTYTADDLTLKLYDPNNSSTARLVPSSDGFCTKFGKDPMATLGCFFSNNVCEYDIQYEDGGGSAGYVVQDIIGFDLVTGNLQTTIGNANILFGCGMKQTGNMFASFKADLGLDGLIGLGASSASMLSQLAASGKMKKKFNPTI
ncbi:aspartic proteinase-like protein 2 [Papaver somniferum]|uniref:aspartic proteinase-like protein 2 n=1 Tax=Papaver somniferum TaxID=3469 RepID=UPI000E70234B|nr:aspartic proteinase-like protein 2 [Papaver somniferum]